MNKIVTAVIGILMYTLVASASETVEGAKKDIATFKQEMTIKLQSLEVEIAKLKETAKTKSSKAQSKAIKNLEDTRDKISTELDQLEEASQSNWKKLKKKIAKSVEKLNARTQALLNEDGKK